ncbi:FG-GAP-like repeat-containing protein [Flavobacterium sp.]|uniref:FG-GAP-like repeat-containing protein n=1 Tax=Flavobacterium sp. TaxID=239 RepID=UPI003752D589
MKKIITLLILFIVSLSFSQNYHDTQGKLDISNSGQATFTLPIAMPPSISSVGPTINISYSSGQNDGIAGQGWSAGGVSYISRIATRQDIDGFKDGVDFDDNDKLALEGQRLLIKTGNYWADGSIYETEVQSNTKIELKGTGAAIYFIVTSPDGSRSWYGNYNGMNATDLSAYYIVRYEDAEGNFILYNYTKPLNKSLCIDTIQFSANVISNITPLNYIKFSYTTATRTEKGYFKGVLMEKTELLNNIKVFTNTALFKEYRISHTADTQLGYQRVSQIQEYNGTGEAANPVLFEYNTSIDTVNETTTLYTDTYSVNDGAQITGDFDGDGKMDIVAGNNLHTNLFIGNANNIALPFSSTARQKFSATTLSNNKLNQVQSIVYADETLNNIAFKVHKYNKVLNNVSLDYTKNVTFDNANHYVFGCANDSLQPPPVPIPPSVKYSNEYLEGDFNGDGLSEILIFSHFERDFYGHVAPITLRPEDPNPCVWTHEYHVGYNEVRLVDLNPNISNVANTSGNCSIINPNFGFYGSKKYVMDFNSDGKADVFVQSDSYYRIISFKQLSVAPWIELETIGEGVFENYAADKPLLFGDYNGDGKPDIMMPFTDGNCIPVAPTIINGVTIAPGTVCPNSNVWNIYYSNPSPTGGVFFDKQSYQIMDYVKKTGDDYHAFYALDVNKDGKTDIVRVLSGVYLVGGFWDATNSSSRWSLSTFINTIGKNGTGATSFVYNYNSPDGHVSDDNSYPIPLVADVKYRGLTSDMLIFRDHGGGSFERTISYVDFTRDVSLENLLKKVTQSNGAIIDEISYLPMLSSTANAGYGLATDFYSSNNSLDYPFVELKQIPNNRLVSQLKNTTLGSSKYQVFKYNGYVVQFKGIGSMGFKKTARSAWYNSAADKKIWSVSEIDPLKRGATNFTYTLQPSTVNFSFPTDLTTGLMSKTENVFIQSNPSIFPYVILLNNQKSTDYITGIVKETVYNTYDNYNLPTSITTNNYLGTTLHGTTTEIKEYDTPSFGTGSNYYIGRPRKSTVIATAYGNTKKASETISYLNGNVSQIDKNTFQPDGVTLDPITMVEKMTYFPNGLLKDKEVSASGTTAGINDVTPRKVSYTYDTTNRFVSTVTDSESLVSTNMSFHPLYGTVLVSKNPFNQTVTNVYDNWGKRLNVIENTLNLVTNYAYTRVGTTYKTTVTNTTSALVSDGSSTFIEQDILAREIRKGSKNLNGTWTYITTEYDVFGRKYRVSEPYFNTASPTQWTTYNYDDYSRPIKTTSFTGKIVNTTYAGLSVNVADSVMSKSKTFDANNQVISTTDSPGGTINFTYDANYNLIESDYDGIKITVAYDNWGRKIQLVDPSSGTNTYSYNAYGEIKTEGNPKGSTTYSYHGLSGRLLTKSIQGLTVTDATNITSNYNYDATTKLLSSITVLNPNDGNSIFNYTYDVQRRLTKTIETQNLLPSGTAVFTKILDFDTFSRVNNETSTATAFGKTSTKVIKHSYSANNGAEYQLKDNATAATLWQANTVDARSNILTATLGNGINVTNTFDQFGYASQFQHKLGTATVMTLNTAFEPILGNLNSRYNSMFDSNDNFTYDSLDRLTSWDNNADILISLPFNTTTDGFTYVKAITTSTGLVSNVTGTMKVTLNKGFAVRNLTEIVAGSANQLRVKATVTSKTASANVIVNVVMVETDPTNAANVNEVPFGTIENGTLNAIYTYSNIINKPKLSLKFVIASSVNLIGTNNGGSSSGTATFIIDNLKINKITINYQNYDDRGRITNNTLGSYDYGNENKPYQNTSISNGAVTQNPSLNLIQSVTYNAFKAPIQIIENGKKSISFGYNANEQRSVMYYGSTAVDKLARPNRRYYSADGSMEISATFATGDTTTPVTTEFLTYIGGSAYSAPVVLKYNGTAYNYFYLHKDYQGSILAITNAAGGVVEKRLFDPWGQIIKIQDGLNTNLAQLTFFDRGYTGHEHLKGVNLINMNARIYNPALHRFLEADNYLQDPYNTQNYNRYGYCVNNPLKYTDVTGNIFTLSTLVSSVIPIFGSVFASLLKHQTIDFSRVFVDLVISGISAGVSFGIGSAVHGITNFFVKTTYAALAHGVFQGGMTAAQGGKFWAGFAAGAVSSIAGSYMNKLGASGGYSDSNCNWSTFGTRNANLMAGLTLTSGAIMGGAGSLLAGGNFWQGAVTGLIVSGFNDLMHSVIQKIKINNDTNKYLSDAGYKPNGEINVYGSEDLKSYANEMRIKVLPLEILYDANGASIEVDLNLTKYGQYVDGVVTIGNRGFTNNRELFLNLLHEGLHAWDDSQGLFKGWGNDYRAITETRSYEIMRYFDKNVFNNSDHNNNYKYWSSQANKTGLNFRIKSYPVFFNNIQR